MTVVIDAPGCEVVRAVLKLQDRIENERRG